jgi:ParB/RepB/Spo0J family partition protein
MEKSEYQDVELVKIDEPTHQLREAINEEAIGELADSMAAEGLHQPIGLVGPSATGRYGVIWGHRRFMAATLLRWTTISARVLPSGTDTLLAAVSENLQRADLSPLEEGHAIQRFIERGDSLAGIARLFRRSSSWVQSRLDLLNLPEDLQSAIRQRSIPLSVADVLRRIDNDDYRAQLVEEAARSGATAAVAAVWAAHYEADKPRIVNNLLTAKEIASRRDAWKIVYGCDACGTDVDYTDTTSWRLCRSCSADLQDAIETGQKAGG